MAGGDLKHLKGLLGEAGDARKTIFRRFVNSFHRSVLAIRRMEKPVIAEVRGAAAGAGFSLALACDLVVAASGSRFVPGYGNIGTSPDGGMTFALPRIVGLKKAFEITLLSDGLDAEEAEALGLINRVVPPERLEGEVIAIAGKLANGAAEAIRQGKFLLSEALEHDLEAQLGRERESFVECAATEDFEEGIDAFLEKRRPKFGRA
jgi:2-(1,2-epoxy-1,2-dihydrophenyl)acetyl-CoA isomerase